MFVLWSDIIEEKQVNKQTIKKRKHVVLINVLTSEATLMSEHKWKYAIDD